MQINDDDEFDSENLNAIMQTQKTNESFYESVLKMSLLRKSDPL